jgi:hypothetical protein
MGLLFWYFPYIVLSAAYGLAVPSRPQNHADDALAVAKVKPAPGAHREHRVR